MSVFSKKTLIVTSTLIIIGAILSTVLVAMKPEPVPRVVTTVDTGSVRQLVSVSGVISAEDTAFLAFPVAGVVTTVPVRKGDNVGAGMVLATLNIESLLSDKAEAEANLSQANSALSELLAGTRLETVNVASETVLLKKAILENTKKSVAVKVENARKALLSGGLTAVAKDPSEDATRPVISGTYTCDQEGVYQLEVFSSNSPSKYSFSLSGLETGTFNVSTDQPTAFGQCGLSAQFSSNANYSRSTWTISIPNPESPTYTNFKNAYNLAQSDAENDIRLAEQELALAEANAKNDTASARPETIDQARATIASASAKLDKVKSDIADRTLVAPFSGVIIDTEILPGETVTTNPVITLQASTRYELTARIPEIDISRLAIGQKAEVVFDTKASEKLKATIDFLSPRATTIDGVAYYEARLVLENNPTWLRGGLNADIDIIVEAKENALRVPSRFITEEADGTFSILRQSGETVATSTIEILFRGNDGYVAVSGISAGDRVVAP